MCLVGVALVELLATTATLVEWVIVELAFLRAACVDSVLLDAPFLEPVDAQSVKSQSVKSQCVESQRVGTLADRDPGRPRGVVCRLPCELRVT